MSRDHDLDVLDPDWAELEAAVRASAPPMRPAFRGDLDRRVAVRFEKPPRPSRGRAWLPRLAVAFACLAFLGGVGGLATLTTGTGSDEEATSMSAGATASTAEDTEAAPTEIGRAAAENGAAASAPAAPARLRDGAGTVTPGGPRKVEKSTTLELTTDADGLQSAADGIVRATQELGGVVARSQVDANTAGGTASFALRLPADRVDDALKRFEGLADVTSLSQAAEDITGSFSVAQERLSDARAERKALLRALGRATTEARIASLRARLRTNRSELARRNGDLDALRTRANLSRVDVMLVAEGAKTDEGGAWSPGDAAGDALRVLEVLAGVALIVGAVLGPFLALGLLALLLRRVLRRRGREGALAGA